MRRGLDAPRRDTRLAEHDTHWVLSALGVMS